MNLRAVGRARLISVRAPPALHSEGDALIGREFDLICRLPGAAGQSPNGTSAAERRSFSPSRSFPARLSRTRQFTRGISLPPRRDRQPMNETAGPDNPVTTVRKTMRSRGRQSTRRTGTMDQQSFIFRRGPYEIFILLLTLLAL